MVTNHVGSETQSLAMRLTRGGVPVLDGIEPALAAVRHALAYGYYLKQPQPEALEPVAGEVRARWVHRLSNGEPLDEHEGLELLRDYGVPAQPTRIVSHVEAALSAADELGYPVVLKTAMPGILHKSDVGGVKLGIESPEALRVAYGRLHETLGPRALLAGMASGSVELAFGFLHDDQFGPLVMVATGGVFIEVMQDRVVALAPLDEAGARRCIDGLSMRPVLDGVRGAPPSDVDAVARALSRLSVLAGDLGGLLDEMDVNPVKVSTTGCVAVDALVIPKRAA